MKNWLLPALPLVGLALVASLFWFYGLRQTSTRIEPNFTIGQPAPEVMAPYLEGGPPVSLLGEIRGPALVNTFASWCAPCIIENPYLLALQSRGVRIVGLAQRDTPADTARYLTRWGDPYAVVLDDRESRATLVFGATGVPETFVVDSQGIIVGKHVGPIETEAQMNALFEKLRGAS